ncbi:MAG: proton-conducting transporter membrane subunit, partial [Candidatus Aminicenantes bacterium]|nr:proton-conducting transporter membrane subunit [Candidatus Aminicenantes bacterium]
MTNNIQTIILLTIFVPIVGSLTIPLAGLISKKVRSFWSVLLALATTSCSMLLIPFALKGGELTLRRTMTLGLDFILVADGLSVFMAIVSSFIGALIVIYSLGYIGHEENQNEYYLIVLLFIGAMMGLVFSASLIFMYLFWEIAAIACWRLIGFYRGKEHVLKADKAFLVTFFGAVFMLLGFIMIYNQTGTFDITAMRGTLIPGTAVLLILLGMFSKSATVPLHTWLPDAGVAPTTVTALLHAAVLVKIGVYAYARLFCYTFKLPDGWYVPGHPDHCRLLKLDFGSGGSGGKRPKTDPGLFHGQPDRLYIPGLCRAQPGRHCRLAAVHPDARPGQGRPLPLRRHRHSRHPRTRYPQNGRLVQDHALDSHGLYFLRFLGYRQSPVRGLFLQVHGH